MARWSQGLDSRGGIRGNVANRDVRHRRDPVGAVFQAPQRSAQARRIGTTVRDGRSQRTFATNILASQLAIVLAAASLGGCATAAPTLATRFVRQGTPTTDLGGPRPRPARFAAVRDAAARPIVEVAKYTPAAADFERQDPALRAALLALHEAPTLANHLLTARAYRRLGILDRAYDHLQRGEELESNNPAVLDATARVWRDWGLPGLGLSHAYRAVHAAPQSATARHTLGTLFYALGLRRDARGAFQEAVQRDPLAWYAWQNLCTLAMADGRTLEAIAFCQRATAARRSASKRDRP